MNIEADFDPETGELLADLVDDAPIDIETLAGDLRNAALGWVRNMPKPWAKMSELEQRAVIESLSLGARHVVREAVKLLAAQDFETCNIIISNAAVKATKDGRVIEGKIITPYSDAKMAFLAQRVGSVCLIVGADGDEYMGEREPAEADPDQPELPVADAGDATKAETPKRRGK